MYTPPCGTPCFTFLNLDLQLRITVVHVNSCTAILIIGVSSVEFIIKCRRSQRLTKERKESNALVRSSNVNTLRWLVLRLFCPCWMMIRDGVQRSDRARLVTDSEYMLVLLRFKVRLYE